MSKKTKAGRPVFKDQNLVKNSKSLRLNNDQVETLLIYGESHQKGIDYLVQWAKENHDLIENVKLDSE